MKIFAKLKKLFSRGEKTTLERQLRAGIVILALALVGLIVYFAVIAPLVKEATNYVPPLLDGEGLYNENIILMEKLRTRDMVISIEIKNKTENYKLIAKDPGNVGTEFYIEGSDDMFLNANNLASLVTHSLVLVTNSPKLSHQDRVNEMASEADLASYGLDAASDPSYVIVNLTDGTSYKIVIGDKQPTGDGYYAMVDGRRNVVRGDDGSENEYHIIYSLTTYVAKDFVEQGSAALISTYVMPYFSNSIYAPKSFLIERRISGSEEYSDIVKIHTVEEGTVQSVAAQTYILDYPKGYIVDENAFSSYVLSSLEYLSAKEIIAYGTAVHDPEVYSKYGLDLDPGRLADGSEQCFARITLDLNGNEMFESGVYTLYFGDLYYDESGAGYRYAYSPYSETIFTVDESSFEYVSWHAVRFISARMFYNNITSLDYLDLRGAGADIRYTISGDYLNYHVDVTLSSDTKIPVTRDGQPLTFDVETKILQTGSYTQTVFEGEFENFRKLYYVLITRDFAIDAEGNIGEISEDPSRVVGIKTTERDMNETFYRYDASGQRVVDSNGKYVTAMYDGGFIRCRNVVLTVTDSKGNETTLKYDTAYYNENNGRFFLKEEDIADSNFKPKNYEIDKNGHISKWSYLSGAVEADYTETLYTFNFYDVLYDYTSASGETVKRVNQTYCYVVPTVTVYSYHINKDGTHELIGEETTVSDGLYMRISQIDKLFSDSSKVVNGVEIDRFGAN